MQRANSQVTTPHAGGGHKLLAAFGAPTSNFGSDGVSENLAARPARRRALTHSHTLCFNGHFPGKHSVAILIFNLLSFQASHCDGLCTHTQIQVHKLF